MNVNFDSVMCFLILLGGLIFLFKGIKAKKIEGKKQAGILSMFLAGCMFAMFFLAVFSHVLTLNHTWTHLISTVQLIIAGMLLGVCCAMQILGHWKLLTKK